MSRTACGCRFGHDRLGRETVAMCAAHEAEWSARHQAAQRAEWSADERERDLERRRVQADGLALLMPQAD